MKIISHSTFDARESGRREFMRTVEHLNHGPNSMGKSVEINYCEFIWKNVHDFVCELVCAMANDWTMIRYCNAMKSVNTEILPSRARQWRRLYWFQRVCRYKKLNTEMTCETHVSTETVTKKNVSFLASTLYIDRRKESFVFHRSKWSDRYFSPFSTRFFIKLIAKAAASISFNVILMFFSVSNGKTFSVTFFAQIFNVRASTPLFHLHLCTINLNILKMHIDCT